MSVYGSLAGQILSIIGATGVPQYQSYVTRSRFSAATGEMAGY